MQSNAQPQLGMSKIKAASCRPAALSSAMPPFGERRQARTILRDTPMHSGGSTFRGANGAGTSASRLLEDMYVEISVNGGTQKWMVYDGQSLQNG